MHELLCSTRQSQGPQAAEWERELNALVYGLTKEEIAMVEGWNH